jgi:hypothetical protein
VVVVRAPSYSPSAARSVCISCRGRRGELALPAGGRGCWAAVRGADSGGGHRCRCCSVGLRRLLLATGAAAAAAAVHIEQVASCCTEAVQRLPAGNQQPHCSRGSSGHRSPQIEMLIRQPSNHDGPSRVRVDVVPGCWPPLQDVAPLQRTRCQARASGGAQQHQGADGDRQSRALP